MISNTEKIAFRKDCNFLLNNVVCLHSSLFPNLRYIQNLWALGIIDNVGEGSKVIDRFYEESYDTIVRILPKIIELINVKFPEKPKIADKIKRANIINCLKNLGLIEKYMDYNEEEYFNLDDILNLSLPNGMKEEIKEKFNKQVFFNYRGTCKIGILCGINRKPSGYFYYILKSNDKDIYISYLNSLTLV